MTPPSDPPKRAPFEIVLTKNEDGTWSALLELPHPYRIVRASRLTGDGTAREAKASALTTFAHAAALGLALPPQIEALFSLRIT